MQLQKQIKIGLIFYFKEEEDETASCVHLFLDLKSRAA